MARRVQLLVRRGRPVVRPVSQVRPLATTGRPLLSGAVGDQFRGGARLDQVDGTTCGSAVLLAVATWADPAELAGLDGPRSAGGGEIGFGSRFDARQKQVHRQTNRFWPQALGTTPWSMVAWLRRYAPAAGPYHVRLVDDVSAADVVEVVAAVDAALDAGRPVPLLVGPFLPRHYVLVVGGDGVGWRVYEPSSGSIRLLDRALVGAHRLGPSLGFDRLHAALLPV